MRISIIVAADENNVIGGGNRLLWQLPDDMKRFRELTKGHPVIMGRKTFESIGRALPGRRNIVISATRWQIQGCEVYPSLSEALSKLSVDYKADPRTEIFIIGGGFLYSHVLLAPQFTVGRIYLTRVHAKFVGDTFFPPIDEREWMEVAREEHPADERHSYPFTFLTYERKLPATC